MTMLIDPPRSQADTDTRPLWRLRTTMAPIRLSFTWFGTQKALTAEQKARAAETFDAQAGALSAGKKLLDTRHSAFRAVTAIRGQIEANWKTRTLPFPEPGIRLIRQEEIEPFVDQMTILRTELADAVVGLDRHFEELKAAARQRLGSLYHEADYPVTLQGLFDVGWDFPNVEPPDYLMALSPALFAQEEERVRARFEEAVALAEQAFLDEFTRLVEHLRERITGSSDDGSPKVFRDSAVGNLQEFFARFRALNVRSNPQLDDLVEQARSIVRGVGAQDLRDSRSLRVRVAEGMDQLRTSLDTLIVDRPRRRILRQTTNPSESES